MRRVFSIKTYENDAWWSPDDLFGRLPSHIPKGRASLLLGTDGLSIKGDAGSTFVSYAEVTGVEVAGQAITIRRAKREDLAFAPHLPSDDDERHRIASEIESAVAAYRDAASRASHAGALVVAGTSGSERLAAYRALLAGHRGSYRTGATTREEVWRVATGSATAERERLGAIVALRVDASEEEKARLASLGDDLANDVTIERIRIAVEGDDAALESLFSDAPVAVDSELASTLVGRLRRLRR